MNYVFIIREIRWIYLSLEPSSLAYASRILESKQRIKYCQSYPKTGEIFTEEINKDNLKTRFVFKVESGLQRESTEIFISYEILEGTTWNKNSDDDYVKSVSTNILNGLSDGIQCRDFSDSFKFKLNDKTEVFIDEDGFSKLDLWLAFPELGLVYKEL